VVKHLIRKPKVEGSKPATATLREKLTEIRVGSKHFPANIRLGRK
jgi:hypothetical protein